MSTDDPSRFAPPFELRIPLGNIVDSSDGVGGVSPIANDAPGPTALIGGSPGLATGAAAPTLGPTVPDLSDPSQVTLLLARMLGEHMTGSSLIPVPAPAQVTSGVGVPGANHTPGASVPSGLTAASQPAGADPTSASSGAVPQPDMSLFAISLSPAQVEAPSAIGLPQSPPLGDASPPPSSSSSSAPVATGGASTGSITQSQLQPGTVPSSETTRLAPASKGSHASPHTHGGAQSGGSPLYGAPPALDAIALLAIAPGFGQQRDAMPHASTPHASTPHSSTPHSSTPHQTTPHQTTSTVSPAQQSPMQHASTAPHVSSSPSHPYASSASQPRASSDPHAAFNPYATSNPRVSSSANDSSSSSDHGSSPHHDSPPPPLHSSVPSLPTNLVTLPAPVGFADELDLPVPTTENPFAAPLKLPFSTPTVANAPSSPMAQLGPPTAAHVPSSSPFGAPVDFSAMFAHPTQASPPSATQPSSTPREEAWPGTHGADPFSDIARIEVVDATALDRLARGGNSDPLVNDLSRVAFDPHRVREDFPILNERPHGKRLVWLDNGATTHKPRQVIDRISYFYEHENSNVHRAAHTLAARSSDAYERARESVRRFLNAPSVKEVVWVRGATEAINLVAKSWGRRHVGKGDEIVISHLEHHANIVPWQMLCSEVGARLRVAPVDDRGDVILEEYEKLLGPRTKLVAITHVSNALGSISPVKRMVEIAHRYGAPVMVDGAQGVSHMKIDVQDIGCDWYLFSGHKVYGPTGIGAVWAKAEIWDQTPPWQGGGNMIADVTFEKTQYQPPPWKFEAGTGNIADAVGLGAAIEYVERIGMDVIDRYEHELLVYGTQRLLTVPGLTIIGTSKTKAGVMSFVLDGQRTEDVSGILDKDGIAVRSGHHCAQPILRRFGVEHTVRASLALYNVYEDIDALVESLHRLQAGRN